MCDCGGFGLLLMAYGLSNKGLFRNHDPGVDIMVVFIKDELHNLYTGNITCKKQVNWCHNNI